MKKWETFTKEELLEKVKNSYSYAELAEQIGYAPRGGSGQSSVKAMCEYYGFSTEHFSQKLRAEQVNIDEVFVKGYKHKETIKKNLLALREHKCECCGLTEWNQKAIPLQVHHKDGDNLNNILTNLELLCPNCHAQTDNFCGKNKEKIELNEEELVEAVKTSENIHQALIKIGKTDGNWYPKVRKIMQKYGLEFIKNDSATTKSCPKCGKLIKKTSNLCESCYHIEGRVCTRPTREQLKELIRTKSFCAIAREYGVSDNAIRKWCESYNLPKKSTEIKKISNEDWALI